MKDALALALVHFVWQGAALALAAAVLLRVTKVPTVRYAIGVATMSAMLLAPVLTTMAIARAHAAALPASPVAGERPVEAREPSLVLERQPAESIQQRATRSPSNIVPTTWVLGLWSIGVMVVSLRVLGGWSLARRLTTRSLTPARDDLQALAAQMASRLNVRAAVRVCESATMAVPVMLGCLRPVIILPSAAVAALPLSQLEALLAHELAHIRRHDYLVNLLQTGVETLFFYHPAVWWISREVRRHREQCCDDVVVGVCDRLTYITALSRVASIATPGLALSATGGSLRDRVRRLIEPHGTSASSKGVWIAMLPILLVIALVTPQAWSPVESIDQSSAREARRAEQIRAAAAALEAQRAEEVAARRRELERVREIVNERRNRETARNEEAAREVQRQREVSERRPVPSEEIARVLEARRDEQSVVEAERRQRAEQLERVREFTSQSQLARLESQLSQLENVLARQKELVEKGLAPENIVLTTEQQLSRLTLQLQEVMLEREFAERQSRRRADVEFTEGGRGERLPLDSAAELQPDDRLTITIAGEPDLPTTFTVRPDGSIRFPFLGSIRVQGSTTAQVQSAIRKLISDRGLASNAQVTVSARRVR